MLSTAKSLQSHPHRSQEKCKPTFKSRPGLHRLHLLSGDNERHQADQSSTTTTTTTTNNLQKDVVGVSSRSPEIELAPLLLKAQVQCAWLTESAHDWIVKSLARIRNQYLTIETIEIQLWDWPFTSMKLCVAEFLYKQLQVSTMFDTTKEEFIYFALYFLLDTVIWVNIKVSYFFNYFFNKLFHLIYFYC